MHLLTRTQRLLKIKMKCVILLLFVKAIFNASAEDCSVVPMSQWAGEASHRIDPLPEPVGLVIVQHTVTPEAVTDAECEGLVRAIRKYHMKILIFDDVGQSFFICGTGKVYEGAGWSLVGAHTKHFNNKAIGVSFLGDFSSTLPTVRAIKAAQDLLSCGRKSGHLGEDYKVMGHRQVSNTQSPGDELQKEIEKWPQWTSQQN